MPRKGSMVKIRYRKQGFTLLEVLIALSILAIGILAVLQLFPIALYQSQVNSEKSELAARARSDLGEVMAAGVSEGFANWAATNAIEQLNNSDVAYSMYSASVSRVGGSVDLFRVTLVYETMSGGEEKFVTYVTRD